MIQREVTIGRAPDSDILFNANCMQVSNHHALIYRSGTQLYFRDMSTNGTFINRMKIHGNTVAINPGDTILLAGRIPLTWDRINIFFPPEQINSNLGNKTFVVPEYYQEKPVLNSQPQEPIAHNLSAQVEIETSRFNWGAFFLYQFWGFANGTWWAFLIAIFFWWTSPIPNLLFGIMGSKWAWQNKTWRDLEHFRSVQESWKNWGIGLFLVNIFLTLIFFTVVMATV